MLRRFGRAVLVLLAAAAGVHGQDTCTLYTLTSPILGVDCRSTPVRTVLPTSEQYGNFSVEDITGQLQLSPQSITSIPDGGFDACPYTNVTGLDLYKNDITTVGARAFARLAALEWLYLGGNAITWMAPTSLDGLLRLESLWLHENRLGAFDYGALVNMAALRTLTLKGQKDGDLRCGEHDRWDNNAPGIQSAIATCGASGSPCYDNAVACPENQTTFPSTPTTTATTIDDGSTSTLGAGAIAGIVVGTLALIGVGVYVF